ncbi:hypothetical protein EQ500_03810, partial [Lactobacillus sp. XV13L]|nr:hypothetical protein [Lactobacillus sp. XV13L]
PYIVLAAVGIVAIYSYAKQHNPAFAEKMQWLYNVAQYIVTQQATHDNKSGSDKKKDATAALLEQAKKAKAKITPETAKGMIEKAYLDTQKNDVDSDMSDIQGIVDDEELIENPRANTPVENVEVDSDDTDTQE